MNDESIYKLLISSVKADVLIALEFMILWDRDKLKEFVAKYTDRSIKNLKSDRHITTDSITLNCKSVHFWVSNGDICIFCSDYLEIIEVIGDYAPLYSTSNLQL